MSQAAFAAAARAAAEVDLYTVFIVQLPLAEDVSDGIDGAVVGPETDGLEQ